MKVLHAGTALVIAATLFIVGTVSGFAQAATPAPYQSPICTQVAPDGNAGVSYYKGGTSQILCNAAVAGQLGWGTMPLDPITLPTIHAVCSMKFPDGSFAMGWMTNFPDFYTTQEIISVCTAATSGGSGVIVQTY